MFGIGKPGELEPPGKENIQNFFLVPVKFECLVVIGVVVSLDAFLYVITYLPIRVVFSLYLLANELRLMAAKTLNRILPFLFPLDRKTSFSFHRTHSYDLMRGAIFLFGCITLKFINMSELYHFIRGQSMIKLYVLTAMIEVMDKLLSSFGQDAFDSLHRQTRTDPRSFKMGVLFIIVTAYVCIHSVIYFLHVATLTVVINSADRALTTVLILNNFSEMKAFVFKKFDCNNLFQLACSDITERFQISLFLALILVESIAQAGESWPDLLIPFGKVALMMMVGESIADCMKHAFINKFNFIDASVYQDFAFILRKDILSNRKDQIILDHTYSVTRRLGLSQIPLGCVCVRYILLAIGAPVVQIYIKEHSALHLSFLAGGIFLSLVLAKVIVGVGLLLYSTRANNHDKDLLLVRSPARYRSNSVGNSSHTRYDSSLRNQQFFSNNQDTTADDAKPPRVQPFSVPDPANYSTPISGGFRGSEHVVVSAEEPVEGQECEDEQHESQRRKERREFIETLSSIERYTVYKGRVL